MKKLYSAIMMLAMMFAALSLTACSDDDDNGNSSSLVGTWDIVQAVYYMDGEEPEYESGNGAYWVFTSNKITVHDADDVLNGKSLDYTYSGNKLIIGGISLYTVTQLTASKLAMRSQKIYGSYSILEFKKR